MSEAKNRDGGVIITDLREEWKEISLELGKLGDVSAVRSKVLLRAIQSIPMEIIEADAKRNDEDPIFPKIDGKGNQSYYMEFELVQHGDEIPAEEIMKQMQDKDLIDPTDTTKNVSWFFYYDGRNGEFSSKWYPNTLAGWRQLVKDLKVMEQIAKENNLIAFGSSHYNLNNDLSSEEKVSLHGMKKTMEGQILRLDKFKGFFDELNFPLLDIKVLFNNARHYLSTNREFFNIGRGKLETRTQEAPTANYEKDAIDEFRLRSMLYILQQLKKYSIENIDIVNPLYLPLAILLGGADMPRDALFRFIDRLFGNDIEGKVRFLKLYYDPIFGKSVGYREGEVNDINLREEYVKENLGALYDLHRLHNGYCADPVGYIEGLSHSFNRGKGCKFKFHKYIYNTFTG